ncbi:MAG: hypothetical protein IJ217_05805 [Clostridia bacterium]|nr:hypothetical protein [Clostridia bacterium]
MKSIGFVGNMDKTELIQYVAKMISVTGSKTILIDATRLQKTRYTIPTINGMGDQNQYIVEHDGIDVAVGFNNILELKKYLISKGEDFNEYDYVLVDIDSDEMSEEYDMKNANSLFFVTSYDKMHITKGIDVLRFICATKRRENPDAKLDLFKILYFSDMINTADTKYIDNLTDNLPLNWNGTVSMPYNGTDISVNIQNQYSTKVDFRYLSPDAKNGIIDIVNVITGEDKNKLKKAEKNIEKVAKFAR